MDPEDYEDINHRYPFVLTTDEVPEYQILYVGQQRLDEIDTYVFDITPKTLGKRETLFPRPHLGGQSRFPDREVVRQARIYEREAA